MPHIPGAKASAAEWRTFYSWIIEQPASIQVGRMRAMTERQKARFTEVSGVQVPQFKQRTPEEQQQDQILENQERIIANQERLLKRNTRQRDSNGLLGLIERLF